MPRLSGLRRDVVAHLSPPLVTLGLVLPLLMAIAPAAALAQVSAPKDAASTGPDLPAAGLPDAGLPDAGPSAAPPKHSRPVTWATAGRTVTLIVGSGKLLRLPSPVATVFVADPSVADVQTPSSANLFVFGRKPGRTTLFALSASGATIASFTLMVDYDQSALGSAFRAEAGDLPVRLIRVPHGLLLSGTVPTAAAAAHLQQIAQTFVSSGETLINRLLVGAPIQVNLRVRVAEVSRSVSRALGFNWATVFRAGSFLLGVQTGFASGGTALASSLNNLGTGSGAAPTGQLANIFSGGGNLGASVASSDASGTLTLDAMADEGLVTMLAEPNLTTTSGESANFLAGGEYPIPIPQALGVTSIEYKNYGVSVSFTPTVLSSGMISLKVTPEVSSLTTEGQSSLSGTLVPALITRRAETTVQLASGQSFAIAGLLQNDSANNVQKIPWLGDIPVLGALFRSTQFQRNQTELVIVVSAYIVQPSDRMPSLPTDDLRQPTEFERLLLGRVAARAGAAFDPEHMPQLRGSAGFLLQ